MFLEEASLRSIPKGRGSRCQFLPKAQNLTPQVGRYHVFIANLWLIIDIYCTMLTSSQLRQAANLSEKIEKLQKELDSILGGSSAGKSSAKAAKTDGRKKKRKMSAEAREKIAAAQRMRWKKQKAQKAA